MRLTKGIAVLLTLIFLSSLVLPVVAVPDVRKDKIEKDFVDSEKKLTYKKDGKPLLEVKQISIKEGVCKFEEVFEVTAINEDYTPSKDKDFKLRFENKKQEDAKHKITSEEWFVWEDNEWKQLEWSWLHKTDKIKKGETKRYKVILTKQAELGDKRILTVPSFMGVEDERLSWWNVSWQYRINSTLDDVPGGGYTYQLMVHSGSGTNTATDVYLQGCGAANFKDLRFTLDDDIELDYWIEDNSIDPIRVFVDVPSNGVIYTYYSNSEVNTASDLRSIAVFGDDFRDNTKWTSTDIDTFWISSGKLSSAARSPPDGQYDKIYTDTFVPLKNYSVSFNIRHTGWNLDNMQFYYCMQNNTGIPFDDNVEFTGMMTWDGNASGTYNHLVNGKKGIYHKSPKFGSLKNATNYFGIKLFVFSNQNSIIEMWNQDYTNKISSAQLSQSYFSYGRNRFVITQRGTKGLEMNIDNLLIRKYQDPEPQWQTWSTEETDTTYSAYSSTQYNTQRKLARTSEGYLHRVYSKFDGSNHRVYYAKSTDSGSAWTETVLTNAGMNNTNPAIASDSEDNLWVVYEREDSEIWYRKYEGLSWQTEQSICWGIVPVIAVDSNDNLHVSWFYASETEQDAETSYSCEGVFFWLCSNAVDELWTNAAACTIGNNGTIYENFDIQSGLSDANWTFRYTAEPDDGDIFTVYSWNYSSSDWDLIFNSVSYAYRDYETIHIPSNSLSGSSLKIKTYFADNGGFLHSKYFEGKVTWNLSGVQYSKYNGSAWSGVLLTEEGNYPSLAVDTNDYIHVAYQQWNATSNTYNIKHQKYTDSWQPVYNITSGETHNQTYPCIATDLSGNAHIVWQTQDYQIKSIKYKSDGSWEAIKTVHNGGIYEQRNPSVSVYSDNYVYATWFGKTATYNENYIIRKSHKTTGSWSAASDILYPSGKDVMYPNSISALYPVICGDCYLNIPLTGYSLIYDEDGTVEYYNASTWRCEDKYVLIVRAKDYNTNQVINNFTVDSTTGGVKSTTNGIVKYTCLDSGYYVLTVSSSGYHPAQQSYVIEQSKEVTIYLTPTSEADYFLPEIHEVRFMVVDGYGVAVEDVTVTATCIETTLGSWDLLMEFFGFKNVSTIQNTTMMGTTDSGGEIVFPMVKTIKYQITFVKGSDINKTLTIYPIDNKYVVRVGTFWDSIKDWFSGAKEDQLLGEKVSWNITTEIINDTHAWIKLDYNDTLSKTTNQYFFVNDSNNTNLYNVSTSGEYVWSPGYVVSNYSGQSYLVGFEMTHGDIGDFKKVVVVTFKHVAEKLVDFGWDDSIYQLVSIALLIFTAALFTGVTVKHGAVMLPLEGWVFWYIGWFEISIILLSIATSIGIGVYVIERGRETNVSS